MIFDPPLVPATLLRRYKRFLADVRLEDGREVTAHCPNPGSMRGCDAPGSPALVAPAAPGRKLPFVLRMVKVGRSWVMVDTTLPNRVVADALRRGRVPELAGYDGLRTEVPYGPGERSRVDVLLTDSTGARPDCYVEVKNVTMAEGRVALFPDSVTTRGQKHLAELAREVRRGHRAALLLFVARGDCRSFDAAGEIDPGWARGLARAARAGVEILPWRARVDRRGLRLGGPIPWTPRKRVANAPGPS